ncbi:MAG: hypothetical protein ABIH00_09090 [Armatimonadota bacterium]
MENIIANAVYGNNLNHIKTDEELVNETGKFLHRVIRLFSERSVIVQTAKIPLSDPSIKPNLFTEIEKFLLAEINESETRGTRFLRSLLKNSQYASVIKEGIIEEVYSAIAESYSYSRQWEMRANNYAKNLHVFISQRNASLYKKACGEAYSNVEIGKIKFQVKGKKSKTKFDLFRIFRKKITNIKPPPEPVVKVPNIKIDVPSLREKPEIKPGIFQRIRRFFIK